MRRGSAILIAALCWLANPVQANSQLLLTTEQVTVFAASSLASALDDVTADLPRGEELPIRIVHASSGTLARQVAAGAPADLVILADPVWMDWLAERDGIKPDSRVDLLGNRLAVVGLATTTGTASWPDRLHTLLRSRRFVMGDPDTAPVGRYARAALEHYGLWNRVKDNAVFAESARTAVTWLARGEVEAGIVFRTDVALLSPRPQAPLLPLESHPAIRYPMALTKNADDAVLSLFDALQRADSRAVFEAHGFTVLTP